jgi:hypothetical protein
MGISYTIPKSNLDFKERIPRLIPHFDYWSLSAPYRSPTTQRTISFNHLEQAAITYAIMSR